MKEKEAEQLEQLIYQYQDVSLETVLEKYAWYNAKLKEHSNEYVQQNIIPQNESDYCDYLIESEIAKKLELVIMCKTMIVKGYVLDGENWKKIDIDSEDEDEELIKKYLGYIGFINIEN